MNHNLTRPIRHSDEFKEYVIKLYKQQNYMKRIAQLTTEKFGFNVNPTFIAKLLYREGVRAIPAPKGRQFVPSIYDAQLGRDRLKSRY